MSIDRKALVMRHNPRNFADDTYNPLSVGNGEFAFTADYTGLQSFLPEGESAIPLCTMAQWGFHSFADQSGSMENFRYTYYPVNGHDVPYMTDAENQEALYKALRINPHRLNLARVSFCERSVGNNDSDRFTVLSPDKSRASEQELNLWNGILHSRFMYSGSPVTCATAVHPQMDMLSIRAESELLKNKRLAVSISFPYGSELPDASNWNSPDTHSTILRNIDSSGTYYIFRKLDDTEYHVVIKTGKDTILTQYTQHECILETDSTVLEASLFFSSTERSSELPLFDATAVSASMHWNTFWSEGGAIAFSGSSDPRAMELERRIILSRYLTAIQCSGSLPPQETGLSCNSWYGKFHLEMHFWHAAHFVLWGKAALFKRSLSWYSKIMSSSRERARFQGYKGARWPKMTDPSGNESPSPIGPYLCWQQPHPIMYAELLRRASSIDDKEDEYARVVFETAEFMASYACYDADTDTYYLGPPLIPAQESHAPEETRNPSFELEYWYWGLKTALEWAERLNCSQYDTELWRRVMNRLAPAPKGVFESNPVYLAHEACPETFTAFAKDHPSMLLSYGLLPGERIDTEIMSNTLDAVKKQWDFISSWGWDFPVMAMTAARLGRCHDAVDLLLMDSPKNTYRPNGHNAQLAKASGPDFSSLMWKTALPLYLPGNGALLLAVAMMAAGWNGAPDRNAPGFPDDGSWKLEYESLHSLL